VDLTVKHPDDTVTAVRLVLVERRLYSLGVTGMINARDANTDPRVEHFLEAFKVKADAAEGK
jgi:hypothetical protein